MESTTARQMSKMLRIELVGLLLLACTQILTEHRDFHESRDQYSYHQRFHELQERITREVRVKEGRLRGMVVQPRTNYNLQLVDVFLGKFYSIIMFIKNYHLYTMNSRVTNTKEITIHRVIRIFSFSYKEIPFRCVTFNSKNGH